MKKDKTNQPTPRYIQIGVTTLRAPDGSFLPVVPLYIKSTLGSEDVEKAFADNIFNKEKQ